MERTESNARRELEFVEKVLDGLPIYGLHGIGRVQDGKGLIAKSRECPEADLLVLRKQLEEHPGARYRS